MIYLILTASLINRHGKTDELLRMEQYRTSITKTLQYIPAKIQPIIVENNGQRPTCLDHFQHHGKPVPILYTDHNQHSYPSKGQNELMDLHAVIQHFSIQPMDMIIKLTGRYQLTSSFFVNQIIQHESNYDAFVKFYNVCTLEFKPNDCVLGCYAIRCMWLQLWVPHIIPTYPSAEIAFARYVRNSGARIKEMDHLDVHCIFADDHRTLDV